MREIIRQGLIEMGLDKRVSPIAPEHLTRYGLMLLEKNAVMNLTAIREADDVARLHMLDCAALLGCCDFTGKRLLDVGTGAGFPGMVLKILTPSLDVTLLDSLQKRLSWLDEVIAVLALQNIRTVHGRAEECAAEGGFREQFDLVTSRAVADLRVLCELCLPYVKVGGQMLAMKSTGSTEETDAAGRAVSILGGRMLPAYDYVIPGTEIAHRVVRIEKIAPTPAKYPRRFSQIKKSPL